MSIVQLADMKAHLNVTFDSDDLLIQSKIDGVEDYVSRYCVICDPDDPDATSIATWSATTVPPGVTEAIKLLVAHLYENREATLVGVTSCELPLGFWGLLAPYRGWVF